MADHTGIGWTDRTWNPTIGCDRVSPGCDNCYPIPLSHMRKSNPDPKVAAAFAGTTVRRDGRTDWSGQVNLLHHRLAEPFGWPKRGQKVFVNSLSDLFHPAVPDEFIARVFAVMALTPQHTYQILTKRHGRMRTLLRDECRCGSGHAPGVHFRSAMEWAVSKANPHRVPGVPDDAGHRVYHETPWPLPNVWLGVSVEDQQRADLRIPPLLETPAAVRFISAEPLLGPVNLLTVRGRHGVVEALTGRMYKDGDWLDPTGRLDWVICGGESGPKARPMHPDWARSLRHQCAAANTAFWFKQWGQWAPAPWVVRVCDPRTGWTGTPEELEEAKAAAEAEGATHVISWPGDSLYEAPHKCWSVERVGEQTGAVRRHRSVKTAGNLLDGRKHEEFPEPGRV